jgi:predicted nucleic acid-binding protein
MHYDIDSFNAESEIKKIIFNTAFKHQDKIDYYTWASLYKNKILKHSVPIDDGKVYEILSNKNHAERILTKSNGPLLCFKQDNKPTVAKIAILIFTSNLRWRKSVWDHFINMQPGHEIGHSTLENLKQIEKEITAEDWVQAAMSFYDRVNSDWLCNLGGLQQSIEIDSSLIQEYSTYVFRPTIESVSSIGIGALESTSLKEEYTKDLLQISKESSDLNSLLDKYYAKYGHIPLAYDYSLSSVLDGFFEKNTFDNQQKWESLWAWADTKNSPLPLYHICSYFVRNIKIVPKEKYQKLFEELLNILHEQENITSELKWTAAWKLRYNIAKHFGQFIEAKLPGANTEQIYSQAWWMSEKLAQIYGNNSKNINSFNKHVIDAEESLSNYIWQKARPRTQNSSLRYVTIMAPSLWATSIVFQIDNKLLEYICENDLSNKNLFLHSVTFSLMTLFPLYLKNKVDLVYAYDQACLKPVEYISNNLPESVMKQTFEDLISASNELRNENILLKKIKDIPNQSFDDQLLSYIAMRTMAYTNFVQDEDKLFEIICNNNWLEKILLTSESIIAETILSSLLETIIQKRDRWSWQIPHLFSIAFQNNVNNEKVSNLAFACVIISSICSDTCSALRRTLLYNTKNTNKLKNHWSKELQEVYHVSSDYTKSRLRPIILCLNS